MLFKRLWCIGLVLLCCTCDIFTPQLTGKWTLVEIRLNDKLLFDVNDDGSLLDSALLDHKAQQDRLGEVMTYDDTLIVEEVHKAAILSYNATTMEFTNDSLYIDKDDNIKQYEFNREEGWIILNKHDIREIVSQIDFNGSNELTITEDRSSTKVFSRWKRIDP